MTKEKIFDNLKAILSKEFEIEEDKITPTAKLGDDLELDSIDSLDLIVKMKDFIPGKVDPAIFKTVKTMQDVVDALYPYTQQA